MKDLSLHILDIANNSLRAKATQIQITIEEFIEKDELLFSVSDNGSGIPDEILETIKNPFTTTRTYRRVGLGIPLLEDTCRLCEGCLHIQTKKGEGTTITARMKHSHIDRPPIGDIPATITTLMTADEGINLIYLHIYNENRFEISTDEVKQELGDVSINEIPVVRWLREYISDSLRELKQT